MTDDGYTDHGDRFGVIVTAECEICGEPYDTPADDDSGCPNGCDHKPPKPRGKAWLRWKLREKRRERK